jgi:hypothetical protein
VTQYTFDPKATMNAAMDEAFNARAQRMLDEAHATSQAPGEFAASKGVPGTLTDVDTAAADAAGLMMKMDGEGEGGYNGGEGFDSTLTDAETALGLRIQADDIGGLDSTLGYYQRLINLMQQLMRWQTE